MKSLGSALAFKSRRRAVAGLPRHQAGLGEVKAALGSLGIVRLNRSHLHYPYTLVTKYKKGTLTFKLIQCFVSPLLGLFSLYDFNNAFSEQCNQVWRV